MVDKCYFCKSKVVKQNVEVDYRWGNTLTVIKDVPVDLCTQCGEKYFSSGVYKEMEILVKNREHLIGTETVNILSFTEGLAV